MGTISANAKSIFLADDDSDDCTVFEDALNELNDDVRLTVTNDGVELLDTLHETVPPPPYVIFLDLNMPRKDGFESLKEIRETEKMKGIPVVILSTSTSKNIIDTAFLLGANYYICKPTSYPLLKHMIGKVLNFDLEELNTKPTREDFVLVA
ncbi:MAG TPA: response regulator [Bacteroidia bacterium]|nr:response regulator [Bacteroidia bacterium]